MIIWNGLNFNDEGWRGDIAATEVPRIVSEDGLRPVSSYIPTAPRNRKVDLSRYLESVWGKAWYLNQLECGACVSFGAALCCDVLMAQDIVEKGARKPSGRTSPEPIYWGSRVEVGGGRISGQGSVGVWAAKWLKEWGALEQRRYPEIDLSAYDPRICCGSLSRNGVPSALETIAKQYPVKSYAQVKTFDEAVAAIDSGYPVTVASDQGFRMELDANGFARPSGTWMHQMAFIGFELDPEPCLYCANSWGAVYVGGPPGWNPAMKKVRAATCNRMLSQGDSWAFSGFTNWAPKDVTWASLNF